MILTEYNLLYGNKRVLGASQQTIHTPYFGSKLWIHSKMFDKTHMTVYLKPVIFRDDKITIMQTIYYVIR
jgi:hypothetical protein